jgi:hypothetical protein
MREAIYVQKTGKLYQFIKEDINRPILRFLGEWFLRRYDLSTARHLLKTVGQLQINSGSASSSKKNSAIINQFQRRVATSKVWQALKNKIYHKPVINSLLNFVALSFPFLFIFLSCQWRIPFAVGLALTACYIPIVNICYHLVRQKEPWMFKLIIPRMLGAIVVGYLPLFMGGEVWGAAFLLFNTWQGYLVVGLALYISFAYLFVEINNTLRDKSESFHRALTVWYIGFLESFAIGLILCHLTSKVLIDAAKVQEIIPFFDNQFKFQLWRFGTIYPQALVLFAPLALFAGIFVQILWEDKPITQPL